MPIASVSEHFPQPAALAISATFAIPLALGKDQHAQDTQRVQIRYGSVSVAQWHSRCTTGRWRFCARVPLCSVSTSLRCGVCPVPCALAVRPCCVGVPLTTVLSDHCSPARQIRSQRRAAADRHGGQWSARIGNKHGVHHKHEARQSVGSGTR